MTVYEVTGVGGFRSSTSHPDDLPVEIKACLHVLEEITANAARWTFNRATTLTPQ